MAPDDESVRVTFLDQTGAKTVEAAVSPRVPAKRFLRRVVEHLDLPRTGPDGTPLSYVLDHREGGRRVGPEETLAETDVEAGDHLIVYPEVIAGDA